MRRQSDIPCVGTLRAGVISLLVPGLACLWGAGLGNQTRAWLFMVLFAVCFVLMMQSIVDLLILGFGLAARGLGAGLGRLVGMACRHQA